MPKSNKERQAELKARREAEGQVRRPYWGTPTEHEAINALLAELRRSSQKPLIRQIKSQN